MQYADATEEFASRLNDPSKWVSSGGEGTPSIKSRWTRIGNSEKLNYAGKKEYAFFRCECGTVKELWIYSVRYGTSKSCGCHRDEVTRKRSLGNTFGEKHGLSKTKAYSTWEAMVARCSESTGHKNYYGRGIRVCDRWLKFENFVEDMGQPPSPKHSIERKDNDGDYCKDNCVWVTSKEQNRNTRRTVRLTFNGVTKCVSDWADSLGVSRGSLIKRVQRGWTTEQVLTVPVTRSKPQVVGRA